MKKRAKKMKSLFIRCSEETYTLAHSLAKKENRSLNKQIIHMIHSMADEKDVTVEPVIEKPITNDVKQSLTENTFPVEKEEVKWGLTKLAETRTQATDDQ